MENKEHIESVYERMRLERKDPEAARVIHDLYHQLRDKESKLAAMPIKTEQELFDLCKQYFDSGRYRSVPVDKPVVAVPECFKKLYDHARGIRFGTDWNNGTAARYHRQPLIDAALDCEKWLAAAPSHSQQSAVIDFKGHCVVRADITLHPLVMIRRANFIECYIDDSLVRKEKVMDNCILKECSIRSEWPDRCPSHESEQGGGK